MYVLCIPKGGLNDMTRQIILCYNYCQKFNRKLIIDTNQTEFKINLNSYFNMYDNEIIVKNLNIYNLNIFSIYPENISKNDLLQIKCKWLNNSYVNIYDNKLITFDLNTNYTHDLLVHMNCGGGDGISEFLQIFSLNDRLIKKLYKRYILIPLNYISIHIRNSDYKSNNFEEYLLYNKSNFIDMNIFISSDDINSINYCKKYLKANIFTFSDIPVIPKNHVGGLHHIVNIDKDKINVDSILDFLLLVLSKEVYYTNEQSGYSKNAKKCNKDIKLRKCILNQIYLGIF